MNILFEWKITKFIELRRDYVKGWKVIRLISLHLIYFETQKERVIFFIQKFSMCDPHICENA
jgi:hypothetical protein